MLIMELGIKEDKSYISILDFLYQSFPDITLNITERTLARYDQIFAQVQIKLKLFYRKNMNKSPPEFENFSSKEFVNFIQTFDSPKSSRKGALGISDFYYSEEGGYEKNARFLFGTAYQFRN